MSVPQELLVRWDSFRTDLSLGLLDLLLNKELVDVTFVAGEYMMSAHKSVLSACSSYFRELFRRAQSEHPIVILTDVGASELELLLLYMYCGKVNLTQDQLLPFFRIGQMFKVKSLCSNLEGSDSPNGVEHSVKNEEINFQVTNSDHFPATFPASIPISTPEHFPVSNPVSVPATIPASISAPVPVPVVKIPKKSNTIQCNSCERVFTSQYNLKVHVRDRHTAPDVSLHCNICHKRFRNCSSLRVHLYMHRKRSSD